MRRTIAALAAVVSLALAPSAFAHGSLTIEGGVMSYDAYDAFLGATVTISSPRQGIVELRDTTTRGGFSWGPCTPKTLRRAWCPAERIDRIEVLVHDGDDVVSSSVPIPMLVDGGEGDDTITGGYGPDTLLGGEGDDVLSGGEGADEIDGGSQTDVIDSRDGFRDSVRCGAGLDELAGDELDRGLITLLECESSSYAAPPADTVRPRLRARIERVGGARNTTAVVAARMNELGTLRGSGRIEIGGRGAGKLDPDSAEPTAPDQLRALTLGFGAKLERRVRRALRAGRKVVLIISVEGRDRAGNSATEKLRMRLDGQ